MLFLFQELIWWTQVMMRNSVIFSEKEIHSVWTELKVSLQFFTIHCYKYLHCGDTHTDVQYYVVFRGNTHTDVQYYVVFRGNTHTDVQYYVVFHGNTHTDVQYYVVFCGNTHTDVQM